MSLPDGAGERSFRIRYSRDGSFQNDTPMLDDGFFVTGIECVEREDALVFTNGKAVLEVERSPLAMRLKDGEGNTLLYMPGIQLCHPGGTGAGGYASLKDFFPFGISNEICTFTTALALNEKIYGLGERFPGMDRRGQYIDFYHQDAAGNEGSLTYKNIPFYMSSAGYGIFVNTSALMDFDIGMKNHDYANVFSEDNVMDVFFIAGPDLRDVLAGYCRITGFAPALPRWSYGLWMSRNSYENRDIAMSVARELRERQIPCDVLHLDTYWFERDWVCDMKFSKKRFPDPEGMVRELEGMGYRLSLWQMPFVHPETDNYRTGREKGYFIKKADGDIYPFHWFGTYYAMIDYSNPEAVEWILSQVEEVLRMGARVIKTDMPENCPPDGVYAGMDGKYMHNLFPLLYNKAIHERVRKVHGEGIVWARSTYAGGQRYPLHWSGDAKSTYENMAGALRSGLSLGLSGHPFWSHDIGGFIGIPTPKLYVRWAQLGLFSSHARCHGGGNNNPREPWAFGEQACGIFRKYAMLRYRLLPYIFSTEAECCRTGLPFIRHMILCHQDDRNTHGIEDQYYFGKYMLVCPMLTESDHRQVYLPEGLWYDMETDEAFAGGRWMNVHAPIDKIPVFVPAGAVIVQGPPVQHVDETEVDELEIHLYRGADGEFRYVNGTSDVVFRNEWENGKPFFDDGGYQGKVRVVPHG
ncbi:MAG: glycoside hydrolase family 31 protein [Clostridia bacterium]